MFWQFNKVHVSHTCQLSQIIWESPGYGTDLSLSCAGHHICWIKSSLKLFCALVWDLALFFPQNLNFSCLQYCFWGINFLHVFSHWQRLFLATQWWLRILIVCNSCKTSYDVLGHSHWGLGWICRNGGLGGGGGGVYEKLSLQILDLQRLAYLVSTVKCREEEPRI